jgi:hypothetical protein
VISKTQQTIERGWISKEGNPSLLGDWNYEKLRDLQDQIRAEITAKIWCASTPELHMRTGHCIELAIDSQTPRPGGQTSGEMAQAQLMDRAYCTRALEGGEIADRHMLNITVETSQAVFG